MINCKEKSSVPDDLIKLAAEKLQCPESEIADAVMVNEKVLFVERYHKPFRQFAEIYINLKS